MSLRIVQCVGLCSVQDLGRMHLMRRGIPSGGALVRTLHAFANDAAGNLPSSATIEVFGKLVIEALAPCVVATEDGVTRTLAAHDLFTVEARADLRVRYLALRGGIDVPLCMNSRSTLLSAELGGYEGRALRKGDLLPIAPSDKESHATSEAYAQLSRDGALAIVKGPDLDAFDDGVLDALVSQDWALSPTSNRVGSRLVGAPLRRKNEDRLPSRPMVRGAIEVPKDGQPIVLGPEHPITGGYPIVAVLSEASLDAFFARPISSTVRFKLAR